MSDIVEEFYKKRKNVLNINSYINEGFEKICDVKMLNNEKNEWYYANVNKHLMYADHSSWVYFIVLNDEIVKCGETGNPLGIKEANYFSVQPIKSSKCRFGRLRAGDNTDAFVRENLRDAIIAGNAVSLWAKKCDIQTLTENVGGREKYVNVSRHKSLELLYLEHFATEAGGLPSLNKAMK